MDTDHISDGDLERYIVGVVTDEVELAPLEEHLLWCHSCIARAEEIQERVKVIGKAKLN